MLNNNNVVRLISNPSDNHSIHEWVPWNVKSMNRSNKMSSIPFYIPNDTMRRHLFRIVLLRGIERGDSVNDDPLAIYVEYIPMSCGDEDIGDNERDTRLKNVGMHTHPEGCRVGVWVVCNDHTSGGGSSHLKSSGVDKGAVATPQEFVGIPKGPPHIYEEAFHVFNEDNSNRMMGFKKIVTAGILFDDRFVDPLAYNRMIIRVEIKTGVTSVVDRVATVTNRFMGSLWGSASSAFGAIHAGVDVLQSQIVNLSKNRTEGTRSVVDDNNSVIDLNSKKLPWEVLPPNWKKKPVVTIETMGQNKIYNKTEKDENLQNSEPTSVATEENKLSIWRDLITNHITEDDGTFLYGPNRGLHPDEQILLTQVGLNHKNIMSAATLFDYNRDVHEGLLGPPKIRKQRYRLVPRLISDEIFWGNYMWKVASLAHCSTNEQVQLLLSILNAPPLKVKRASEHKEVSNTNKGHPPAMIRSNTTSVGSSKELSAEKLQFLVKEATEASDVLEELLEGFEESQKDRDENINLPHKFNEIERESNVPEEEFADLSSEELLMKSAGASCAKYIDMLSLVIKDGIDQPSSEITDTIRLTYDRLQKLVSIAHDVVGGKAKRITNFREEHKITTECEDPVVVHQACDNSYEFTDAQEKNHDIEQKVTSPMRGSEVVKLPPDNISTLDSHTLSDDNCNTTVQEKVRGAESLATMTSYSNAFRNTDNITGDKTFASDEKTQQSPKGEQIVEGTDITEVGNEFERKTEESALTKKSSANCNNTDDMNSRLEMMNDVFDNIEVRTTDSNNVGTEVIESGDGEQHTKESSPSVGVRTSLSRKIKFDPMPWDEGP